MLRRLFCLFSAFTVLFFASVPVFATGMTPGGVGGGVTGIPVVGEIQLDVVGFAELCRDDMRGTWNFFAHLVDEDICPNAPQMNGGHNFVAKHTLKQGQVGMYYVCEYCGRAYGDMLEEKYEEYVQETFEDKPSTKVSSSGNIPISTSSIYFNHVSGSLIWTSPSGSRTPYTSFDVSSSSSSSQYCFLDARPGRLVLTGIDGQIGIVGDSSHPSFWRADFIAPCDGTLVIPPTTVSFRSLSSSIDTQSFSGRFLLVAGQPASVVMSHTYYCLPAINGNTTGAVSSIFCEYDFSGAYIEPTYTDDTVYAAENRVAGASVNNSGLYGYVENGQLVQSGTNTIFTESGNVYTNPVTGDTSNVTNWQYDYSDRSYKLTTEEGDTVTVTYGDSNVTINEGGTTYNVYYLMSEEGVNFSHDHTHTPASSDVTLAPTCTGTGVRTNTCAECGMTYTEIIPATGHSYSSAVTMPPTCTNTGVRTFTCANCGDTYTVSIAATGHTWEVVRNVSTEFDENGQLVREGYTLYQCSVCGEQYKITADSGGSSLPSPSSDGTSTGNTDLVEIDSSVGRGFLATIARGLTEDLPEVLSLISEWFTTVPALYDGYSKFLAASFAWMPPDCVMLLTFSVGMVTVIAICRAMFRR